MTITFLPGFPDVEDRLDEALRRKADALAGKLAAIHLSDEPYDIIAHCLQNCVPAFSPYWRWGLGSFTGDEWQLVKVEIRRLSKCLRIRSLSQIDLPAYHADRLSNARLRRTYLAARTEIADMLDEFTQALNRWTSIWPAIHIHGY